MSRSHRLVDACLEDDRARGLETGSPPACSPDYTYSPWPIEPLISRRSRVCPGSYANFATRKRCARASAWC
jgi:hypothetical protein